MVIILHGQIKFPWPCEIVNIKVEEGVKTSMDNPENPPTTENIDEIDGSNGKYECL